MDVKLFAGKIKSAVQKFKYAAIVLVVGLALLLLPTGSTGKRQTEQTEISAVSAPHIDENALAEILQSIQGAGKVQVLLSTATGEKTLYQTNTESSLSDSGNSAKTETVIVTDGQRTESGLVSQVNPPLYLGAIVVCQGADSPAIKYAITQAVAKITGLGTDAICVLKMK